MDPQKLAVGSDGAEEQLRPEAGLGNAAWSIRKLIELLDDAIDSAGAQLARSAGLWADSPAPVEERSASAAGRRSSSLPATSLLEELERDHGASPL